MKEAKIKIEGKLRRERRKRGGKSHKPSYILIWFLLHSLLLVATTPTCNGEYQIRYGFVVISIIRRGGIIRANGVASFDDDGKTSGSDDSVASSFSITTRTNIISVASSRKKKQYNDTCEGRRNDKEK